MISRTLSALGMALLLAGACGGTKPEVSTAGPTSTASVARHKSYAIEIATTAPQGYSLAKRSQTVLDMARPKIDAELAKKGYVVAASPNEADLVVRIAAGVKTAVEDPSGGALRAGADSDVDEVSTLVVTIIDRQTQESLFTGKASKEIHSRGVKESDVGFAVTEILEAIPSSSGGGRN